MMNPYLVKHQKQFYRTITSGFIHADYLHLFVNMFVLYSFGRVLQDYYAFLFQEKAMFYLICLYIGGIILSDLPTYLKHQNNPGFNSLGASGAVSAVLFSYIFINPLQKVYAFMFLPLPGIVWGILYMGYSIYASKRGGDFINHDAHLFGAIFGILFTVAMKPELAIRFYHNIISFF
jgi:membrane associated rhomboid family serine protease